MYGAEGTVVLCQIEAKTENEMALTVYFALSSFSTNAPRFYTGLAYYALSIHYSIAQTSDPRYVLERKTALICGVPVSSFAEVRLLLLIAVAGGTQ